MEPGFPMLRFICCRRPINRPGDNVCCLQSRTVTTTLSIITDVIIPAFKCNMLHSSCYIYKKKQHPQTNHLTPSWSSREHSVQLKCLKKHSGRKAMLSRLGGAAPVSSGPVSSLDIQSGNSRQDEPHPDTVTATTLPT